MRKALRKADNAVVHGGWAARLDQLPYRERERQLDEAYAAARKAAREDVEARWAREDATELPNLPPHITRVQAGSR